MKKRILFFIPDLRYGGAEKVMVNLLNNLDRNKYELSLLTLFGEGINKQYLRSDVKHRYIFKKVFRGNTYLLKLFTPAFLYRQFVKEPYDLLVAYLEGIPSRVFSGCPDRSMKKISWVHIEVPEPAAFMKPYRSFHEGIDCYKQYDAIVGVSQTVIESFQQGTGISDNLYVKYNTVEDEQIRRQALDPIDEAVWSEKAVKLCSVGRLNNQKGYERLLSVHRKLIANGFACHLAILGQGENKAALERYIAEHTLSGSVTLLGYKTNPYKYVKNSDLFVCSSYKEGFSTAVTEALIVGTPVITTRCSGMDELLDCGRYGMIVENDEDALYEGLKKLLTDKELLAHYKAMAVMRGGHFSTQATVAEVEKLFDQI